MKRTFSDILVIILHVLGFILNLLFFFPAVFILEFPFWLAFLAYLFISCVPVFGSLLNIALWIWALIVCLHSPASPMVIFFYVMFALNALNVLQALIRSFYQMFHK